MEQERKSRIRRNISLLEADVAYFDARLALLEEQPRSRHQAAQAKVYRQLEQALSDMLVRLQGRQDEGEKGVEVVEIGHHEGL